MLSAFEAESKIAGFRSRSALQHRGLRSHQEQALSDSVAMRS